MTNVSGTRQGPYWAGNYAFDYLIFCLPLSIYFIIAYALGEDGNFVTRFTGYLVLELALFAFSFIGYSYLFSFIFQKSNTAFRFFPFLNLVFFYFLPLIPATIDNKSFLAQYVMPLLSPFVAFNSFWNTPEVVGVDFEGSSKLWFCYAALIFQSIVYLLACLFLESLRFSLKSSNQEIYFQNQHMENAYPQANEEIVQHLQYRQSEDANFPIKIENLTKVYGNGYMAIRNNSFNVKQG